MVIIPDPLTPPAVNPFAERVWARIPQAYRDYDAGLGWPLLLYIDAVTQEAGAIQVVIERILGARPIGPAAPEPWGLHGDALTRWRDARRAIPSALGDPVTADDAWLPWLGQIVGIRPDRLAFAGDVTARRNLVRYATGGWRAGTRPSIEYAARPVLTDSQYARVVTRMRSDDTEAPTIWDVAVITRTSETPDPGAVLDAIVRAGVKPAGVVLWHRPYLAPWAVLEARRPTWELWEEDAQGRVTWARLEETGLSYADVPGNLLDNSSFEDGLTGWNPGPNTTQGLGYGGLDGQAHAELTATGAGQVSQVAAAPFTVNDGHDYRIAVQVNPEVERTARLHASYDTGSPQDGPDVVVPAGTWATRLVYIITAPVGATEATVSVQVDGLAADETVGVDAWDAREWTG